MDCVSEVSDGGWREQVACDASLGAGEISGLSTPRDCMDCHSEVVDSADGGGRWSAGSRAFSPLMLPLMRAGFVINDDKSVGPGEKVFAPLKVEGGGPEANDCNRRAS